MAYRATKPTRQVTGYDPITGRPIASSAADANAARQDASREAISSSIGVRQGQFGDVDESKGAVRINSQTGVARQGTEADSPVVGDVTTQSEITAQTRERGGAQSPYQTSTARGWNPETMGYDRTTGTQSVTGTMNKPLGVIDRTAVDRLMASGLSEADARAQVQANRPDVQEAFNQVGASGLSASQEEQIARFASGEGYGYTPSPVEVANMRAAVAAQNKAAQETENLKMQESSRRANESAASTAASAESTRATQDGARLDRISAMLDGVIAASGDPMGPVYKEMMMQDLQDREDAEVNASLSRDASIARAEDQNDDVQDLLDKYIAIHRENNDKYTELLDETRDSQQKYLAEQEQRDLERLAWDSDREQQKLAKAKSEQLLSQSIQNALGGGAFSGAANEQLASTEREWDKAISDMAKEFSFKKADVSAFYTQKYIDTNNQFNLDVFNAAKELDAKVEGYSIQGFNSLQAMENAKVQAENDYRTAIDTAKKEYSASIKGYVKEMSDSIKEERRLKEAELKAERDREWQERKFYENMEYQYGKQEATERRNSAKVEKADEKLVRTEFTRISESPTVKDYAKIRNSSEKARSVLENAASKGQLEQSVAKEVVGVLYEKVLDPDSVVREGEYERAGLAQGVYKKAEQALKILEGGDLTGLSQDLIDSFMETIDVMSRAQKESAQAEYIGAINRMVEFNAQSETYNINPATLSLPAGIQIPEWATQAYYEDQESSGGTSFDVNWEDESSWGTGGGESEFGDELLSLGRVTQSFDTPVASKEDGGLYSASTVAAWGGKHAGVDLAVPQGTGFRSLIDGEVVDFGYTDGWGGTVVIKDANGAEHRVSHLTELNPDLEIGSKVQKGQKLALTGGKRGTKGAGNSTGAHIDYRVRYNGNYVDPTTYSPYA